MATKSNCGLSKQGNRRVIDTFKAFTGCQVNAKKKSDACNSENVKLKKYNMVKAVSYAINFIACISKLKQWCQNNML